MSTSVMEPNVLQESSTIAASSEGDRTNEENACEIGIKIETVDPIVDTEDDDKEVNDSDDDDDNEDDDEDNEDDDEDGSDSDIMGDEVDVAEEEPVEDLYVPITPEEIPSILDALESDDTETWNSAVNKLEGLFREQNQFAVDNIAALDIARFIKRAKSTSDGLLRTSILTIVSDFYPVSGSEARKSVIPFIPDIVPFLGNNDVIDRQNILGMLENIAEEEPLSHAPIIEAARLLYEPIRKIEEGSAMDEEHLTSLVECLENAALYSRETCRKLFLQAGAFDAVLVCATSDTPRKVRLAAQSCLTQLMPYVDEIDAVEPEETRETSKNLTFVCIISAFMQLAQDADADIAKAAAEFITEDRGEANELVNLIFLDNPKVATALILLLAKKAPRVVGTAEEFALLKFMENPETKIVVTDGFRKMWEDENVDMETKCQVIRGLVDSFLDIRKVALEAGMCRFVVKSTQDERKAVEVLAMFDKLMEDEQMAGSYLLETEGAIKTFVDILGGPFPELRCRAASILSRTLESYKDGESQRDVATAVLTEPAIYSAILAALHSDDLTTVNAAANLVGEILAGEDGTQSWYYEEDSGKPPPPTPLKDAKVTPELALYTVGLLKQKETAVGALYLLCQLCWGYQRGLEVVQKAFEAYIADADAFFFAALYGKYIGKHSGRQRRVVAEAAVKAGAIARAVALLEAEHETIEIRRAAADGLRNLLAADSADFAIGRTNQRLPAVLAQLVADGTKESLTIVNWMVRLLADEEDPKTFETWTEFAKPDVVDNLIKWLNTVPETFEKPNPDDMTEEEFEKADAEYDAKVAKAAEECQSSLTIVAEMMTKMVPVLMPFASKLIGPILNRTDTEDQNTTLMELLNKFAASEAATGATHELVAAVKVLLSKEPPPSLSNCHNWILLGPSLAIAFYLGGVFDRITKIFDISPEEEPYLNRHEPLQVMESLAQKLAESEEHLRGLQKAFFANEKATQQALAFLRDKESIYDSFQAAGELFNLSKGYPEGITFLENEDVYPTLLELFNHEDFNQKDSIALLGFLCHADPGKLTELSRSLIAGLSPPTEDVEAPPTGKKGKKGKGKKKKFHPRISETEVLGRFASLSSTTPTARKALVDAGVIEFTKQYFERNDDDLRVNAFRILQTLVDADEGYIDAVAELLPILAKLFKDDECATLLANLQLVKAFVPKEVGRLLDAGMHRALVKAFTDFPSSVGDMQMLIDCVRDIIATDTGRGPMVEAFKESLDAEDALEQELNWGNAHALRRLLCEGDAAASAVVEAGGIEYSLRLLQSEDLHIVAIGGALCATLARCESIQARSRLMDLAVMKLMEEGHSKAIAASEAKLLIESEDLELEAETAAHEEKIKEFKKYAGILSTSMKVVTGEEVEGYEEDFFV
ncbi:armadillo-type protein [Crassisporium funariophilum]|nr:armadillo-type protein [Crassisporium funariophilum]